MPKKKSLHVYIDADIYEKLKGMCTHHGNLTYLVNSVLRNFVDTKQTAEPVGEKETVLLPLAEYPDSPESKE